MNLEELISRLRAALSDENAQLYSAGLLDEALRQALARLCSAGDPTWTVAGLDGALVTSLPALEQHALLLGACAAAVHLRALQRIGRADLESTLPEALRAWAASQALGFEKALEDIRRRCISQSATPPYGESGWEA